jgi:hypothetical protein
LKQKAVYIVFHFLRTSTEYWIGNCDLDFVMLSSSFLAQNGVHLNFEFCWVALQHGQLQWTSGTLSYALSAIFVHIQLFWSRNVLYSTSMLQKRRCRSLQQR